MAVTKTTGMANVLDPAKSEAFVDGMIRQADLSYTAFCRVRPATSKTIEKTSIDPPGTYANHAEAADFSFQAIVEANNKTYTQSEVALAFQVSSFAFQFLSGNPELLEFIQQIGAAATRSLNADGYGVVSGGFSDTGPDGVSLFSASHPANVGGNQSNTGTTALGEAGLQAALTQARRMKTPDNILASARPQLLVVPPDLEYTAKELVGSALSGGDMQINVLGSMGLTVVVAPDMTDASDWFIVDPGQFRCYQYIAKGSAPKQWIDNDSDSFRISDRMIYTQGYDAWRGAWGHSVA